MLLKFLLFLSCCSSSFAHNETIKLTTESFLLYLDNIESKSEIQKLTKLCEERTYAHTVYYRVLYFRFCDRLSNVTGGREDFDNFCDNLKDYYGVGVQDTNTVIRSQDIEKSAESHQIFGLGIKSDQLWEAHLTCISVRDFYHQKNLLNRAIYGNKFQITKDKEWFHQPNYTEWLVHAIPFCLPVSCGFTKHAYYNRTTPPAIFDCLPPSYKAAIYIVFCIDSLIILASFLANISKNEHISYTAWVGIVCLRIIRREGHDLDLQVHVFLVILPMSG